MLLNQDVLQRCIPYNEKPQKWPQIFGIFMVSLAAFTSSLFFNWTSPSIPILISNSTHLDTIMTLEEASYFTIIPLITNAISAPFLAVLVDLFGRRQLLMLVSIPQILAWIMTITAENTYMFYFARILPGIADAIVFNAGTTYIGEISTPSVRGAWGNLLTIGIHFGQLFINIVGSYCGIRTTAYIFISLPVIYIFLMQLLPETPYFLIMKGREEKARESLQFLRWTNNVDNELTSITKDVTRQISESGTLRDLFIISTNKKALLIVIVIRTFQQFSGMSAFAHYNQFMFNKAGGNISASTSAIIYSALLCILISAFSSVADKYKRTTLTTSSFFACGIVLLFEATYFCIDENQIVDTTHFKWMPLAGMLVYIVACSSGLAILPTLMLSEFFSASIKSKALCVSHITFCISIICVSKLFQVLTSSFGLYVPFYVFGVSCFLGAIFSYYCIPETKGKTLEEIQQSLINHKRGTTKNVICLAQI